MPMPTLTCERANAFGTIQNDAASKAVAKPARRRNPRTFMVCLQLQPIPHAGAFGLNHGLNRAIVLDHCVTNPACKPERADGVNSETAIRGPAFMKASSWRRWIQCFRSSQQP